MVRYLFMLDENADGESSIAEGGGWLTDRIFPMYVDLDVVLP